MTVTTKRSIIALLLSLVLVVSLFTVSVGATETVTVDDTTEAVAEDTTEAVAEDTTEATTEAETDAETEAETEDPEIAETRTTLIINGIIIAVIILIIVLVAVKFRKKLGAFLRSVKSEMKKIVWASKENTRKAFLVVFIVAVAFAIALGLIDFAFQTGISGLAELFK